MTAKDGTQTTPGPGEAIPPVVQEAQARLLNNDPQGARAIAQQIQQEDPQNPISYKIAATALANEGNREGALKQVEAGLNVAPQDTQLQQMQKLLTKKTDDAGPALLKQLTALQQPQAERHLPFNAAPSAEKSAAENVQLASVFPISAVHGAAAPRPDAARQGLGNLQVGDPAAAERSLTRHLRAHPGDWMAYHLRAMSRYRLKNYPAAYEDATQALAGNPKDAWALKIRALALMEMSRYADANQDLRRALALNAYDADAYRTRARLMEKQGRTEDMLKDLKRAAELDPVFEQVYRQALSEHPSSRLGLPRKWTPYAAILGLLAFLIPLPLFLRDKRRDYIFTASSTPPPGAAAMGSYLLQGIRDERSVGGYEILRKLGQGGMGVVYEAFDPALRRKVALKRMRDEISGDRREAARFLREAKTVAALSHPNIVRIYSVVSREDGLYLVFEHVPGQTLGELLERRGALPPAEALGFMRQMAKALDYAHERGIIHRDLKPSNVMVAEDGTAKVMDFGIARSVQETLARTGSGEVVGTPPYMAPEQESGKSYKETDVYALGVCLYEMLTGKTPPRRGRAPLEGAVEAALAKALAPEREGRYRCAGEFLAAVEPALS